MGRMPRKFFAISCPNLTPGDESINCRHQLALRQHILDIPSLKANRS
jgi:hypothetical protein